MQALIYVFCPNNVREVLTCNGVSRCVAHSLLKGLFCSEVTFEVNRICEGLFEINCLFEVNIEIKDSYIVERQPRRQPSVFPVAEKAYF